LLGGWHGQPAQHSASPSASSLPRSSSASGGAGTAIWDASVVDVRAYLEAVERLFDLIDAANMPGAPPGMGGVRETAKAMLNNVVPRLEEGFLHVLLAESHPVPPDRAVLEESLKQLAAGRFDPRLVPTLEWDDLAARVDLWKAYARRGVRVLLAAERKLCERVFDTVEDSEQCFAETAKGSMGRLFDFVEAFAAGHKAPERLFAMLDIYETLQELQPDFNAVVCGNGACRSVRNELSVVLSYVGVAVRGILADFERNIEQEDSRPPPAGSVHGLTSYVVNYLGLLFEYSDTINKLYSSSGNAVVVPVPKLLRLRSDEEEEEEFEEEEVQGEEEGEEGGVVGEDGKRYWGEPQEEYREVGRKIRGILKVLEAKLLGKALTYRDAGLAHFFMMNNVQYIARKVKGCELRMLVGDDWIRDRADTAQQQANEYLKVAWNRVMAPLREVLTTSFLNPKGSLKEIFKQFSTLFEEACRVQRAWMVNPGPLQQELHQAVRYRVLSLYTLFYKTHGATLRHQSKYIKYTPQQVNEMIGSLFEGHQGVIAILLFNILPLPFATPLLRPTTDLRTDDIVFLPSRYDIGESNSSDFTEGGSVLSKVEEESSGSAFPEAQAVDAFMNPQLFSLEELARRDVLTTARSDMLRRIDDELRHDDSGKTSSQKVAFVALADGNRATLVRGNTSMAREADPLMANETRSVSIAPVDLPAKREFLLEVRAAIAAMTDVNQSELDALQMKLLDFEKQQKQRESNAFYDSWRLANPQVTWPPQNSLSSSLAERNKLPPRIPRRTSWDARRQLRRSDDSAANNKRRAVDAQAWSKARLGDDQIVMVLLVHNRPAYLKRTLAAMRRVEGIQDVLLIVSHDGYYPKMDAMVRAIDFCPVKQIYFPFSPHLFNGTFPAASPDDCQRRLPRSNCSGQVDQFGRFRDPRIISLKHHWWWAMNAVWGGVEETRGFKGHVVWVEEDHLLFPNALRHLRALLHAKQARCPHCIAANLAPSDVESIQDDEPGVLTAERMGNVGYAFNRSVWELIHAQAKSGAWCTTPWDCYNRSSSLWGSSKHFPDVLPTPGILSAQSDVNPGGWIVDSGTIPCYAHPGGLTSGQYRILCIKQAPCLFHNTPWKLPADLYDWNLVIFPYCDGASFSGDRHDPLVFEGVPLFSRGRRILDFLLTHLTTRFHMGKAQRVLISGCSAGALVVYLHCDYIRHAHMPPSASVQCLADSGLFLDIPDISGGRAAQNLFRSVLSIHNVTGSLPASCVSSRPPEDHYQVCCAADTCAVNTRAVNSSAAAVHMSLAQLLPLLRTPTFIINSNYDLWLLRHALAPPEADPSGELIASCLRKLHTCNQSQLATLQGVRDTVTATVAPLLSPTAGTDAEGGGGGQGDVQQQQHGVFLFSCLTHCTSHYEDHWLRLTVNNQTLMHAVRKWLRAVDATADAQGSMSTQGSMGAFEAALIDCPYPCNSCNVQPPPPMAPSPQEKAGRAGAAPGQINTGASQGQVKAGKAQGPVNVGAAEGQVKAETPLGQVEAQAGRVQVKEAEVVQRDGDVQLGTIQAGLVKPETGDVQTTV
ncbi:unnamed protein product, partial [Closterium sp. Yama58-4]